MASASLTWSGLSLLCLATASAAANAATSDDNAATGGAGRSFEERAVRDAYFKLMRYQAPSRDEEAWARGARAQPQDYLSVEVTDVQVGLARDLTAADLERLVTQRAGDVLDVTPQYRQYLDDPVHAAYDARWTDALGPTEAPSVQLGGWETHASYAVTIRLDGRERSYRALALIRRDAAGRPEVLIEDRVTAGMGAILRERAPRIRVPWAVYVRSSLYRAVVDEVRRAEETGALNQLETPAGTIGPLGESFAPASASLEGTGSAPALAAIGGPRVRLKEKLITFGKQTEVKTVTAEGGPQDGVFVWASERPDIVDFVSRPECRNQCECTAELRPKRPGRTKIRVFFRHLPTYELSPPAEATVKVVSKDVMVVAWVDASPIDLPSLIAAANPGVVDALTQECPGTLLKLRGGTRIGVSDADRRLINGFLLAHSANQRPPSVINPESFIAGGDYRLVNRMQIIPAEEEEGGAIGPGFDLVKTNVVVGRTPDPCLGIRFDAEEHPHSGSVGMTESGAAMYQLAEGRIGLDGQKVNRTNNFCSSSPCDSIDAPPLTPWIWATVKFDTLGKPLPLDHQVFPAFYVYEDNQLVQVIPQGDLETFIAMTAASQRTVPIP